MGPVSHLRVQKNPGYYGNEDTDLGGPASSVVISSTPDQGLPTEPQKRTKVYFRFETFKTSTDGFRYRTLVTV